MKRWFTIVFLLFWLVPVLACNAPVSPAPDVKHSIEQTLTALPRVANVQASQTPLTIETAGAPVETVSPPNEVEPLPIVTLTPKVGASPTVALPTLVLPTAVIPTSPSSAQGDTFEYISQSGDTAAALSLRFGIDPQQILDLKKYPPQTLLPVGLHLSMPNTAGNISFSGLLLPDSEIVYSPSAASFSVGDFIQQAGGFLSTYSEMVEGKNLTGAQIVQRVADETSINPRILLAFLEYRSRWVFGQPADPHNTSYPIGFVADQYSGLERELTLVARQLTIGYYGWRSGKVSRLQFLDHTQQPIYPAVNAGTAAVQYLFSTLYKPADWQAELYDPGRFIAFYWQQFGNPWQRAAAVEPLLPDGLAQPALELPFAPGNKWVFTGGPHAAWGVGSALGGLDFAPSNVEKGCTVSRFWDTALVPGTILRADRGQVIEDLDGDGHEQTGWVILYLHVAAQDRVAVGTHVNTNDPIGHPSCEGGLATGSHVHIARKYNGEWLAADGPLPFLLSGWQAVAGDRPYVGSLVKTGQVVKARPDGDGSSLITR